MKQAFLVWVTAAMLVLAGSTAWAVPTIQINDLQENTPSVVFDNFSGFNSATVTASSNEFVNITGFVLGLGTFSEGAVMLEPGSNAVSDFATLTSVLGGYNLTFLSDGAPGFDLALAAFNLLYSDPYTVVENGAFQTLFPNVAGNLLVQAESDVSGVPVPPSLLLLGSGLLGLAGWRWRRFRKS